MMDTVHHDLHGTLGITPDQMVPKVGAGWKHDCLCQLCPGSLSQLMVLQKFPEHHLVRCLLNLQNQTDLI